MSSDLLSRRHALVATACAVMVPLSAQAHAEFGPVRPELPVPRLRVTTMDGERADLASLLLGRVTALQLIFTGCSATCPIQGAVFAQTQAQLAKAGQDLRLLSVSIDPLGDDVKGLKAWLGQHGAQAARWTAALPTAHEVDRLFDFLRGRAAGVDRHTAQAFVFDRRARLAHRTEDMPSPQVLAGLMASVAARG